MKNFLKKEWVIYVFYVALVIIGIWFLTRLWIPDGFVIAGHDSGLALDAGGFLRTRFFAWDDRIGFGVDNSPHFGSIMLHSIDYILSLFGTQPFAGNHIAVFFWISLLFVISAIFSYSLKQKLSRFFPYLFPLFLTFNFFIFQSIFILERAKYELVCATLLFLTFALGIFFDKTKSILRSSIIFALILSLFNGGSWMGLPLYGGLLVSGTVYLLYVLIVAVKEKNFLLFKRALIFSILSLVFFIFLNLYSILPFVSTLIGSDYAKVVGAGTISAGKEWLIYISRGTFFINLFRFQGVPDWYLTGGLPNPEISYANLYLTNGILVLISFVLPILSFAGMLFAKEKNEKYLISFFAFLLLVSMFFTSGTNSPLGFIYTFLYERIPGFSIFRSPYFKFAGSFIIAFSVFLAYSLSKFGEFISLKIKGWLPNRLKKTSFIIGPLFILTVAGSWLLYNFIIFNSDYLFKWQPDKSTLVKVPSYATEFNNWLKETNFSGRALMIPALDGSSGNDNYTWGYWSLSPLPSVLFANGSFVANDVGNNPIESDWVIKLYSLLLHKDPVFFDVAQKLGINYVFLRNDFLAEDKNLQKSYEESVTDLVRSGGFKLVKNIGPWSLYIINGAEPDNTFRLAGTIFSVPKDHIYLSKELTALKYMDGDWVDSKDVNNDGFKNLISQEFFPLSCDSCLVENLGKYTDFPSVRVLPNSPFYVIKEKRNEKILLNVTDENSKLAAYLGLVMTKLSEIRSMYDLRIEKRFIKLGLTDLNNYLKEINGLISNSDSLKLNFYFASRIYETINPIQRYFRDYISNSNYGLEKPDVKEEISKVLWETVLIKKQFDSLLNNGEKWSSEKIFNISLPNDGQYKLMIDVQTLPNDNKGGRIYPASFSISKGDSDLSVVRVEDARWLFTNTSYFSANGQLKILFQDLPNMYQFKDLEVVDFPVGTRGCAVGNINYFNKNRNYNLKLSSSGTGIFRLYIKENRKEAITTIDFLKGDVEVDVALNPGGRPFEYIYAPSIGAVDPQIYVCRYDSIPPDNVSVNVTEIFSPEIYAIKSTGIENKVTNVSFQKIDPTKYSINVNKLSNDTILVFNETFNSLWRLTDISGKLISNHLVVDGYSNGWLLPGGKEYKLSLVYWPQELFKRGTIISISTLVMLLILYLYIGRNDKNEKNK